MITSTWGNVFDKARPIFREVEGVNSIGGELNDDDPALNHTWFEPCNCYTIAPLVINQAQLDWPLREGFPCKRIEEYKQESVNTQSEIAYVNEARMNMVFKLWS